MYTCVDIYIYVYIYIYIYMYCEQDQVSYHGLLNACARAGRAKEAERWLDAMQAAGIRAGSEVISYIIIYHELV